MYQLAPFKADMFEFLIIFADCLHAKYIFLISDFLGIYFLVELLSIKFYAQSFNFKKASTFLKLKKFLIMYLTMSDT